MKIETLNALPLGQFKILFSAHQPPQKNFLRGVFQAAFVGPAWLRQSAKPMLVFTGLGGWWGKEFDDQGNAINIVLKNRTFQKKFPMQLIDQASSIDQRPGLALRYKPGNPFPWMFIMDELRQIDNNVVLGMTMANLGILKKITLPFILQPVERPDGL